MSSSPPIVERDGAERQLTAAAQAPRPARARRQRDPPPSRSSIGRTSAACRLDRRCRISMATIPWPGAGTQTSSGIGAEIRAAEAQPAHAGRRQHQRIVARRRPASAAACRRCRESARSARRGRRRAAARSRRTLLVPIVGAVADARSARRRGPIGRPLPGSTSASRGSSRGSAAAMLEAVGQHRRHVLRAVDREVDVAARAARPRFP